MNKFQKESQNIFSQRPLSQERQEVVMNKVYTVKKKTIKPAIAFFCISVIVILLAMTSLTSSPEYSTASLIKAYETSGLGQNTEVMETYTSFITENDGFIIFKEKDKYAFHYALFENSEWKFIKNGVLGTVNDHYTNWKMNELNNKTLYSGIIEKSKSTKILVGDQQPNRLDQGYSHELWFAIGNSKGTPIYIVEDGIKRILLAGQPSIDMHVPVVYELVGDDYKMEFKDNTMDVGYNEYNEFPIVIDPDYYSKNHFQSGDVVLVNGSNGLPTITRVITTGPTKVDVIEGTILLNGYRLFTETHMYGHIKGDSTLTANVNESYGMTQKGELFVMPDNWGSEGVRGMISEQQVLGKVLGYHLPSIKVQFSEEELALYEAYKKEGDSALIGVAPQTVARLSNYASLNKDYEMVYSLIAQNEMPISLDQFKAEAEQGRTDLWDYLYAYDAYLLSRSKLKQETQPVLVIEDVGGKPYFYYRMVKENGIWKVGYLAKQ